MFLTGGVVPLVELEVAGERETAMQLAMQHGAVWIVDFMLLAYASFLRADCVASRDEDDGEDNSAARKRSKKQIRRLVTRAFFFTADHHTTTLHIALQHTQLQTARKSLVVLWELYTDARSTSLERREIEFVLRACSASSRMSVWHVAFKYQEGLGLLNELLHCIEVTEKCMRGECEVFRLHVLYPERFENEYDAEVLRQVVDARRFTFDGVDSDRDKLIGETTDRVLLRYGATVEACDTLRTMVLEQLRESDLKGVSPLHYLAVCCSLPKPPPPIRTLQADEDGECITTRHCNVIDVISNLAKNSVAILAALLRDAPAGSGSLLYTAACHGNVELVAKLCSVYEIFSTTSVESMSHFVDARNMELGTTALWVAASKGHAEIVRVLAAAGANPHVFNNGGVSALSAAVQCGHKKAARVLVDLGAEVTEEIVQLAVRGDGAALPATSHSRRQEFNQATRAPPVLDERHRRTRHAVDEDDAMQAGDEFGTPPRSVSPTIASILQNHLPVVSDQGGLDWYVLVVLWVLVSYAVAQLLS